MRVLAAVDKFRGTATAAQVAAAIGHACWDLGHECIETPIGDGGEGTLDVLGGANRTTRITNPLGKPVEAQWRFVRDTAIIEMARASGLTLVGGATKNDVIAASTVGTGELIDSALNDGAKKIIVCVGGSATVDGGLGAIKAIKSPARLRGIEFLVACDVQTSFTDAAKLFGAQRAQHLHKLSFSPPGSINCSNNIWTTMALMFPKLKVPVLPAVLPAAWPRSARRSCPASTSLPMKSACTNLLHQVITSSQVRVFRQRKLRGKSCRWCSTVGATLQ